MSRPGHGPGQNSPGSRVFGCPAVEGGDFFKIPSISGRALKEKSFLAGPQSGLK